MPAKQTVVIKATRTKTRKRVSGKRKGNTKRCSKCGRFM